MPASAPRPADPQREYTERVLALYRQSKTSGWGSLVVTLCLVAIMSPFAPQANLLAWLGLTLLTLSARIALLRGFASDPQREQRTRVWGMRHAAFNLAVGACWGAAPFALLHDGEPFAVASFLTVLALICAGNIAAQSCYLPAVYAFLSLAVPPAALRLALFPEPQYLPVAFTVAMFFLFMVAYARVQSRQIGEAIRLRLENLTLIEALRAQTEQAERLRERAEQANRAKSQFLAAASHDLRQPLHALGLFSAALQELATDAPKRAVVDNIFASIEALETLFNELLDLSKLDAGYIKPALGHLTLARSFERLLVRYGPLARGKGLELEVDAGSTVVYSDPLLLERLLGNLVANAIQYTEKGTVSLAARNEGDHVRVEVSDTGIGIPRRYRERVFEEFFQVANPERDRRKGLGLGLAIVRRLSAILDHPVQLQSEEGRGSRVSVRIPRGAQSLVEPQPPPQPEVRDVLEGKIVLVVEDDASVLEGMTVLLRGWGCEVLPAAEAKDAIRLALERRPHLVVADLRLRTEAGGSEVIEAVRRALGLRLPALLITGDTAVDALEQAGVLGCPVLHKPVRPVNLRAALSQLLSGAGDLRSPMSS